MTTVLKKKSPIAKKLLKKKLTYYRPMLFSRHPSHQILRTALPLLPFRSVIRLGSTTPHLRERVECNTIQAIKNSASKLLMKQCFIRANVKTAQWWTFKQNSTFAAHDNKTDRDHEININLLPYPIVAKSHFGSRGNGNYKVDNQQQLESWMRGKDLSNYIFEKFSSFSKEYRIHVTNEGCFYACRKLLKNTAPEGTWQLHDDGNVSWILETNPSFKKPNNWNLIIEDCVRAKNALGLDICSFDVMTQGSSKTNPEWIIIESQSAPSFGEITTQKYIEQIPRVLKAKYGTRN